jgi:hypothetical protein
MRIYRREYNVVQTKPMSCGKSIRKRQDSISSVLANACRFTLFGLTGGIAR